MALPMNIGAIVLKLSQLLHVASIKDKILSNMIY